ncbi:ABC transporter substrate-binding protein [Candidatus Uhrbacteria bacterium]|nr:ABC transporter substrate-binding protein [Candidatus Uhrbacteria bacterium]
MKNNALWWVIGIIIVIGLGYLVFSQKPTPTPAEPTAKTEEPAKMEDKEIKMGWMGPLTGDAAALGVPIQKGTMLAVDEINAAGGIGGKKLTMIYGDSKCDGKEASTVAQKLISVDQVKFIVGGACSGEVLGAATLFNENKVVALSPSASSPDITTKGGDYVFRTYPSDAMAGAVAAGYATNNLKAKTAAIISENTDYAQGLHKVFKANFEKAGGKILADEVYDTGTTEFRTQALKFKNAKVDVVYLVAQSPPPAVTIVKALKDQKIESQILSSEVLMSDDIGKQNGAVVEGVTGLIAYLDETNPSVTKFISAYKAKFNEDLVWPFFMDAAYTNVYLFKDMIEKNSADPVKVQAALAKLSNWTGGAMTNVSLDENGDIKWSDFQVKQFKAGKLENLAVFKYTP